MGRNLRLPQKSLVVAGAVQTMILWIGTALFVADDNWVAGGVALGSWAALGLAATVIAGHTDDLLRQAFEVDTPRPNRPRKRQARKTRPPAPSQRLSSTAACAMLPLLQVPSMVVITAIMLVAGMGSAEDVLIEPGLSGVVQTAAITLLIAYMGLLIGVLVSVVVVLPMRLLGTGLARLTDPHTQGATIGIAVGTATVILSVLLMSISTVEGISAPSDVGGRRSTVPHMLVILGQDLSASGYRVIDSGWLWTGRISAVLLLAGVALVLVSGVRQKRGR